MRRFLMMVMFMIMTLSMIACSSTNQAETPNVSTSPAATAIQTATAAPSPTPDAAKVSEMPTSTAAATAAVSSASAEPTPSAVATADTTKTTATPAPSAASVAATPKAETPKPAASPEASKSSNTPNPTAAPPAATQPAAEHQAEISPQGKKVLLVGRDSDPLPAEDVAIADRLKGMGFSVTHFNDRELTADATNGYDLIYISQTTNSKFLKTGFMKDVAIPTVYVKSHGMFYLGLSSQEEGSTVKKIKSVDIVDSQHQIAGGLKGTVDVYLEASDRFGVSYGVPGKEAKVIATVPGDKSKAAVYYYDKGTKADNGYEVKARVSFYYWSNGMQDNSTDAGWKLWDNLVLWTLQNG
ncbi:hypothetical protein [Paenibacillus hexagrammi]|uniref:Uncharacterized protein n=1 Tax=Paenibacillus hexagrammi TaxID=2908839 RepID=A0ABY3SNR9_9BACL|nr:hypothetical protein [Paenibacillus sp. YPD9-1]UJF35591.1 hypothetical protein L0M14_11115 [Paenibacillus sp. YPD9-1]